MTRYPLQLKTARISGPVAQDQTWGRPGLVSCRSRNSSPRAA